MLGGPMTVSGDFAPQVAATGVPLDTAGAQGACCIDHARGPGKAQAAQTRINETSGH